MGYNYYYRLKSEIAAIIVGFSPSKRHNSCSLVYGNLVGITIVKSRKGNSNGKQPDEFAVAGT
jgi:hypothetical protein